MQASNHYAIFMIAGMPFKIPISWISHEHREVQNHVQASEQAQQLPVVCMSHNQLSIEITIPQILDHHATTIALLKSYLLHHTQLWSSLKYQQGSMLGSLSSTIPFTGITLATAMPYITGYLGAHHYLLGGMLSHFSSLYQPQTLMEVWKITIDALNISLLRQSQPMLITQMLSSTAVAQHYSKYSLHSSEIERS